MKGKINLYFTMPNVAKFRSRIANPSKELTADIRKALAEVAAEVLNENILNIRAKFIRKVAAMDIAYGSEAYKAKVESIFESFFDVITSAEKPAADATEADDDKEAENPDACTGSGDAKAEDWE